MKSKLTIYESARNETDRHDEQHMSQLPKLFKLMNPRINPTEVSRTITIAKALAIIGN